MSFVSIRNNIFVNFLITTRIFCSIILDIEDRSKIAISGKYEPQSQGRRRRREDTPESQVAV